MSLLINGIRIDGTHIAAACYREIKSLNLHVLLVESTQKTV